MSDHWDRRRFHERSVRRPVEHGHGNDPPVDGDALDPDAISEESEARVAQLAFVIDQCVEEGECTATAGVLNCDRRRVRAFFPVNVADCPLVEPDHEFAGRAGGGRLAELAVFERGRPPPPCSQ